MSTVAQALHIVERSILAAGTAPATQQALATGGSVQRARRGSSLFSCGAPAAAIMLINSGDVRLLRPAGDGAMRVIGHRSAREVAGEGALAGGTYVESAHAMTDVEALLVPRELLLALVPCDSALVAAAFGLLAARLNAAEEVAVGLLRSTVEQRLCRFLLAAAERWGRPERGGTRITAVLTHAEMAAVIGATRETVTLTLTGLRRAGTLRLDRRQVVVLARDALEARASGHISLASRSHAGVR